MTPEATSKPSASLLEEQAESTRRASHDFDPYYIDPVINVPGATRPNGPSPDSIKLGDRSASALLSVRGPACSWVIQAMEASMQHEGMPSPEGSASPPGSPSEAGDVHNASPSASTSAEAVGSQPGSAMRIARTQSYLSDQRSDSAANLLSLQRMRSENEEYRV